MHRIPLILPTEQGQTTAHVIFKLPKVLSTCKTNKPNQRGSGRRRVSLEVAVTRWELVLDRGGDESLIVAASPAGTYSNFGYRR